MNILISQNWLSEHLQTDAKVKDIQKYLSLSGPSVEHLYQKKLSSGIIDTLYDIEVTTNRVDMMSIAGIAREAATILKRAGFATKLLHKKYPLIKQNSKQSLAVPEIVYQTDSVKRVMAVVLDGGKPQVSPQLIQDRLVEIEVNVHDAIIDITNYITHELGHPCHVFDYDKIMAMGGKIIIKEAGVGKKFITLDGVEHQTVGGEIVFENPAGEIIDLPAVKGTANSGVDNNTQRILFWFESLDAKKVRHASMSHAIRTIAAQLNEKNVDPYLAKQVLSYGVELLQKLAKLKVASKVYDYFPAQKMPSSVRVSWQEINQYLGLSIPIREIVNILTDLGCKVTVLGQGKTKTLKVLPPSYRSDLEIPADIIEEIARIYGYHNLPSQLMATALPNRSQSQQTFNLESKIKHLLAHLGWQEIYSYSLVSETEALMSGYSLKKHLKLQNPLKEENSYLRRSIIPSLLTIIHNNPQQKNCQLFEIANLYHPKKNALPTQEMHLTMLSQKKYRQVKADFRILLKQFYVLEGQGAELLIEEQIAKNHSLYQQSAKLVIKKGKQRQVLGSLHLLGKEGLVGIEIKLKNLLKVARAYPHYQALSNQSSIVEQLTFTIKKEIAVGELVRALQKVDQRVQQVELLDIYQNNYTFNLIYRDKKINLSNEDVEPIRQKVVAVAEKEFKAQLVGKI